MVNVVIPAAGLATRMRPLTNTISKAMLPVNGKPAIGYILDHLLDTYQVNQVVIVDGQLPDIRNRFKDDATFVRQETADGPLNAIRLGVNALSDWKRPLIIWLGDTIVLDKDLPFGTDFLLVADKDDHSDWCMTDGRQFNNKPATNIPGFKALVGVYGFSDGLRALDVLDHTVGSKEISVLLSLYQNESNHAFQLIDTHQHYDVGNFNNYYKTCAQLKTYTARSMNRLEVDTFYGTITKKSDTHGDKIQKEKLWYLSLNERQKLFTPRVIQNGSGLTMTLEPGVTLADMQVFDDLSDATWSMLIHKIFDIMHNEFYDYQPNEMSNEALSAVYLEEPTKRLVHFAPHIHKHLQPIAFRMYNNARWSRIIHGDLHTGNILFEPATGKLTFIDPRGEFGLVGPAGDIHYDMYKLFQDLYHGYHFLLHGVERPATNMKQTILECATEYGYNTDLLIEGGLFLMASCVPFHADNPRRQNRFLKYVSEQLGIHNGHNSSW